MIEKNYSLSSKTISPCDITLKMWNSPPFPGSLNYNLETKDYKIPTSTKNKSKELTPNQQSWDVSQNLPVVSFIIVCFTNRTCSFSPYLKAWLGEVAVSPLAQAFK